jgi:predicted phosphodiesterase
MKLCLTSDTHYGFSSDTRGLLERMLCNIAAESPDVVLHAGDWASTKFEEFEACVKLFRQYLPNTPIIGSLGNHDYWAQDTDIIGVSSTEEHLKLLHDTMTKYNILTSFMDIKQQIAISAMQSWYKNTHPPSNDHHFMVSGNAAHHIMCTYADTDYARVLQHVKEFPAFKHVVVSHFTPYNYRYGYTSMCGPLRPFDDLITEGIKYLCLGHSHEYQNELVFGCRLINTGSNYDEPKFVTFEV